MAVLALRDQMESTMLFLVDVLDKERLLVLLVSAIPAFVSLLVSAVGKKFRSKSSLSSATWSLMILSFCNTAYCQSEINRGAEWLRPSSGIFLPRWEDT